MKESIVVLGLCFTTIISFGQSGMKATELNMGFERCSPNELLPDNWFNWGSGYDLIIDTIEKKSGKVSMLIEPAGKITQYDVGSVGYAFPVNFTGMEIELRAYMKLLNVVGGPAYLGILAVDSTGATITSENTYRDNIQGTSDWTLYSVKMPFPGNAKTIYIGAALTAEGQLWVDDFQLFIDGKEIGREE